jgi:ankyrin repeat protein
MHLHRILSLFGYLTLNEKLYVAVHQNNLYKARKLLSHGASPSYIPVDYKSICAHLIGNNDGIRNHYIETSLFASISANDSMLYMAVSNNNYDLVKELIKHHNYRQIGHHTGVVSLCLAVKRGYINIVESLIDNGHINPNDSVQLAVDHCKTHSDEIQRYHFPLYRKDLFIDLKKIKFFS